MKIQKLLELLQPHSDNDEASLGIVIWDVDAQEERIAGITSIQFVFDANGDLTRVALEAE